MSGQLVKIRRYNNQSLVTIPKRFAVWGRYDEVDYVIVNQNKNGDLSIRRIKFDEIDKDKFPESLDKPD